MKKILISLITGILLVCALSVCVNAAGSTSDEFAATPDTIEGVAAPNVIGASERVVVLGADGLYYTFPAYYVSADNTSFSVVVNNLVNAALGYADGTNLKSYIVRIEIPNGVTYIGGDLGYKTALKYVKMSNTVTSTADKAFYTCTSLETIVLSNSLTKLANDMCWGCTSLTSPITIPSTVTYIGGYCFYNCKITAITNYAENVTSIGGNAFSGCPITEFNFPDNLTSIGDSAFTGCNFTTLDIPNSVTTIGKSNFSGCTNLKVLKLPESLTEIPHDFIKQCNLTLIVPKGCTKIYSQYSLGHATIQKIIFTGAADSAFLTRLAETNKGLVSKVEFANHCEIYYDGVHTPGEGTEKFLGKAYVSDYVVASTCGKCDLEFVKETIVGALFVDLGYAKAQDGSAFTYDIIVNKNNVEKYQNHTGTNLSYGFIVGAYKEGDTGDIIGVDGNAIIDKAIVTDFAEIKFNNLDKYCLKMTGITEAQQNMLVYCNAYINNNVEIAYMGAVNEDKKAQAVSYLTLPVKD